ncbi:hypothetical protein LTR17_021317 [Elasticomyces elasticus]|nr:hypothetical protein LTR17_021317 [Elasticomyces elasticus]
MAGHVKKRKRSSVEDKDAKDEEGAEGYPQPNRRRGGQQPTPPDSIGEGPLKSSRNLIAFDFTGITPVSATSMQTTSRSASPISPAPLIPPPPSPSSASLSYDPEFGDKLQQPRARIYGAANAAAFPPGQPPLLAREAEELAQMELKRRFLEDHDFDDGQSGSDEEDKENECIAWIQTCEAEWVSGKDMKHRTERS